MSFDFKTEVEVNKIYKTKTEKKKLFLPFILFCIPIFGFFAILIGDFRYAKIHCNGFNIAAKFLMFAFLSLMFPALLDVLIFFPILILPALVLPYLYARFNVSFYNEAIRKFG